MSLALPDDLVHVVRPARGTPEGALVLLHGRGADEHDLVAFLDLLDPHGRLVGITPGGPLFLPPGGRHWYVVRRVGYPDPATFGESVTLLSAFLDALPEAAGVPWERIVLGGFSQGGVMSYALGLGPGRPRPAGIVALSCFMPTVEGWAPDLEGRAGLPVWIAHGRRDPVIGVEFGRAARDLLTEGGLDVSYDESDAAHHVDPRSLAQLPAWVAARTGG
ncbi:MAG: phospholipase [Solirubrobacteraceae bacterium]|nr:phospholipase [Solirubrobacteraceae bacterium]